MAGLIYTIGHSSRTIDEFIAMLRDPERDDIQLVVDVRSYPASRFASQFDRAILAQSLRRAGTGYLWMGNTLGGRLVEPSQGELGRDYYRRLEDDPRFRAGLARLQAVASARTTAIMCSEWDPCRCHRAIIIGRRLAEVGWNVLHIRRAGDIIDQTALKDALVQMAKPTQMSLFSTPVPLEDVYASCEDEIAPRYRPPQSDRDA